MLGNRKFRSTAKKHTIECLLTIIYLFNKGVVWDSRDKEGSEEGSAKGDKEGDERDRGNEEGDKKGDTGDNGGNSVLHQGLNCYSLLGQFVTITDLTTKRNNISERLVDLRNNRINRDIRLRFWI